MVRKMNYLRRFSILGNVLGCNLFGIKLPIACHYSITNRCPWKCSYCAFNLKDKKECNTEEAKGIIRDLARNGNARLHLTGGEPALREDLAGLVDEAKRHGLFVTMASTGYRFPEIWDRIKDIEIFFLSFDGPREIHDAQRGRGAFDTLFAAIEFLQSKAKKFWTTTVITGKNIAHIDYILDTAKKMNFKANFHLLYFTDSGDYLEKAMHPPAIDEDIVVNGGYRSVLARLLERKRTDMRDVIGSSEPYLRYLLQWEDYSKVYSKKCSPWFKCWAGKMYCYIDANGDVYPCADMMGQIEPRNILRMGFKKAFESMPAIPCQSCIVACHTEINMMFSLRLDAVLNWNRMI